MAEFVRIKDTKTGNEFTAHVDSPYANGAQGARFKVLDKQATGVDGLPLPAKSDPLRRAGLPVTVDTATVEQLTQFAADQAIDLAGATKQADLVAAINKAEEASL